MPTLTFFLKNKKICGRVAPSDQSSPTFPRLRDDFWSLNKPHHQLNSATTKTSLLNTKPPLCPDGVLARDNTIQAESCLPLEFLPYSNFNTDQMPTEDGGCPNAYDLPITCTPPQANSKPRSE